MTDQKQNADPRINSLNHGDKKEEDNNNTKIVEPFTYISEIPGKGIRNQLIQAFNHWFQIDAEQLSKITEIVAMLHNASLL